MAGKKKIKMVKWTQKGSDNMVDVNAQRAKYPQMASIAETAKIFGVSDKFVREKVKNNSFHYVRSGRKVLINLDVFADFLNRKD